jgi:geranylgeranyl pyrophosphate synthase
MSAQSVPPIPFVRRMLDDCFEPQELSRVLGLDDEAQLSLARRVLYPPVADIVSRPGKELRARLVEHAFAIALSSAACTCAHLPPELPQLVEMLHTGSLVIDDIEDEGTMRRGAPALHRTWGVPIALNAGNWMYFWPMVVLQSLPLCPSTAAAMQRRIAITMVRCHQGQALDLGLFVDELSPHELLPAVEATTRLKTGALFELACALGAIAAHASARVERALSTFGREIGVALQMFDDLSGITSRKEKGHEDRDRPTWVRAWRADGLDIPAMRKRARSQLDAALHELRHALPEVSLGSLERDVRVLERAYV